MNPHATTSTTPVTLPKQRWLLSGQINEAEPIREYQIHDGVFTIGRRTESSLCLPVGCVSKNHAEIAFEGEQLVITDLGSTNGTFVNGRRIEAATPVSNGDLIQFASIVFRLAQQGHVTEHQTIQQDNCDAALALIQFDRLIESCLLYTSPSPRDRTRSRMPSSA